MSQKIYLGVIIKMKKVKFYDFFINLVCILVLWWIFKRNYFSCWLIPKCSIYLKSIKIVSRFRFHSKVVSHMIYVERKFWYNVMQSIWYHFGIIYYSFKYLIILDNVILIFCILAKNIFSIEKKSTNIPFNHFKFVSISWFRVNLQKHD